MARHRDPLLRITRLLLFGMMAIAGLVALAMAVAIPGIWLFGNHVTIETAHFGRATFGAVTLLLAMVLAAAVLAALFLRKIVAIIDSVKLGSPFVPENAQRLRAAAWLVLGIEGLILLANLAGGWLAARVPDADVEIDLSFGWLVTALLLFILARVFDQGTRLAQDVEGTV